MRKVVLVAIAAGLLAGLAGAQPKELRPSWNAFTPRQDVQLGREAAEKIEAQVAVVHNRDLDGYLNTILRKLERSQYARTLNRDGSRGDLFPFTIRAVSDKNVNAFSLPGGPIFVDTGLIDACENEAQLAGVIGHEMSHVVLRHSTSQASRQNLVALPALLASAIVGNRSLLAELTQIGIAFTANSALLKFSRTDEEQADYNGAEIAADAGYNPLELANFFERLEAKGGGKGSLTQFLSDHPNPGNRVAAVEEEIRQFPNKHYVDEETGQFASIQRLVRNLPVHGRDAETDTRDSSSVNPAIGRPSGGTRVYRGEAFSLEYPDNWRIYRGGRDAVTIAPPSGVLRNSNGREAVGYGLEVNRYRDSDRPDLERDTDALIRELKDSNPGTRTARATRSIEVDGRPALLSTLYSRSPFGDEREVDAVVTVARPGGLFYMIFIAPGSEFEAIQSTFEQIVRSVRF